MTVTNLVSTSNKVIAVDQDGDAFTLHVRVPGAWFELELGTEEAGDLAAGLERLVEARRCEVAR